MQRHRLRATVSANIFCGRADVRETFRKHEDGMCQRAYAHISGA
jgi:hypothetical protein